MEATSKREETGYYIRLVLFHIRIKFSKYTIKKKGYPSEEPY